MLRRRKFTEKGAAGMTEDQRETIQSVVRNLAHDVRSPMTSILGFTQLMLGDDSIDGENREYLQLVEGDVEKLNQLILDALEKIEGQK